MATIGVWHLVLKDGEPRAVEVPQALSIRVTNIALGEEIADANGRTVVKLSFENFIDQEEDEDDDDDDDDGEEDKAPSIATTVLGALTPGKIEQVSLNVTLESATIYEFKTAGKNTIYLTGNYFVSEPLPGDEHDSEFDSDEEGHFLDEVSSDVEVPLDPLADMMDEDDEARFEEVEDDEPPKSTKRPRESDAAEEGAASKSETKKKLKGEGGKAVAVEEETKVDKKDKKKKKKEKKVEEGEKESSEATKKGKKEAKSVEKKTLPGGIVTEDEKIGSGIQAKKGSTVKMRYIGKLTSGKVFDQNIKGTPFTFKLGQGEVIKGWDQGIIGMQAGGERRLTIPAALAYGKRAQSGIPANSTLVFEVKCLEVK